MSLYLIYNHDGHKFANRMVIRYTDGLGERASDVTWKCLSDLPRSLVFDGLQQVLFLPPKSPPHVAFKSPRKSPQVFPAGPLPKVH